MKIDKFDFNGNLIETTFDTFENELTFLKDKIKEKRNNCNSKTALILSTYELSIEDESVNSLINTFNALQFTQETLIDLKCKNGYFSVNAEIIKNIIIEINTIKQNNFTKEKSVLLAISTATTVQELYEIFEIETENWN